MSHYDGMSWQLQPTTTTTDLTDIAGSADGTVLWAGGVTSNDVHSVLLRRQEGASWQLLWQRDGSTTMPPFGFSITSLTVVGEKVLFATPTSVYGLLVNATSLESLELLTSSVPHFPYTVRAAALNDITVAGDNAMIYHYNGSTWQLLHSAGSDQNLYGLAVSKHMILAVGVGNGALIVQGLR